MALFQDGLWLLDQAGMVVYEAGQIASILGLESALGKSALTLIPPELAAITQTVFETGDAQEDIEVTLGAEGKNPQHLRVSVMPCAVAGAVSWLWVVRDLSPVLRLESIERDFITNVSHELRTPLTSIKMAAESLQMGAIANEKFKDRFLSNIQREADRLTRLVNELLVLSNVQEAKTTLHLSSFDTREMLEDVIATMQPHAKVNDIVLAEDFSASLPMMLADRDRILQVLINLVDNAVKCTPPKGSVSLHASCQDDEITLKVIDTGIGIPSIDLPRIFDRFFRVDKSRSRVTGGTGLGLSIVKDIIEAHSGSIHVESTINVGTTFIIVLPVRSPDIA